jgi:predicted lipoprotein with Yx(FWY)xxD motif
MARSTRPYLICALGMSAALALGACGSSGGGSTAAPTPAEPTTAPTTAPTTPPTTPPTGAEPATGVSATTAPGLGAIVADDAGRTLYRFDKDTAKPPTSNCVGPCAALWPPVSVDARPTLTGIDPALLGTVARADGSTQLTLKGWPLYRFGGDKKPGDTAGQGIKGVWFAVTPDGAKAAG